MDFANILFAGPCNQQCAMCIGSRVTRFTGCNTLASWPLPGMFEFTELCEQEGIRQISVTGINTDPLLYHHPGRLISFLRHRLPQAALSLHTNGRLVSRQADLVNQFDRVTISFASFDEATSAAMTGRSTALDFAQIVCAVRIPLKISVLVCDHNRAQLQSIIRRCAEFGIRRMVLRRPYGETGSWNPLPKVAALRSFAGNAVVNYAGMEITLWDFATCSLRCLNLFPDGSINDVYDLGSKGASHEAAS